MAGEKLHGPPVYPPRRMAESRDRWLLGAFVLSGAAGLGYEILWTRLLGLALGSETLGVLGVLAGFFGGMALGAAALHGRARTSADPVRLFVRLELTAAVFAVLSPLWLHALAGWLPSALGPGGAGEQVTLALTIAIAGLVLLPGTFCLGATLPALVEARRRVCPDEPDGRGLGRLYAANTAGAVLGVLFTVHVLLPLVGMVGAAGLLAGLGLGAALVARRWGRDVGVPTEPATRADDEPPAIDASKDPDPEVANEPWLLLALLAGTGLAGVGLEVVAIQVLSQVLENTIFTFAHVLAVYLLGTAAGAALYTRYAARAVRGRPAIVIAGLLIAHGVATVWAAVVLGHSPAMLDSVSQPGTSFEAQMLAEVMVAALTLGPVTLLMGALFSHVAGLVAARGIGRAYALNTLGGAVAPFVFGVGAIVSMGYRDALFAVVYTYLLLFGAFTWFRRFKPAHQIGAILGVVALTAAGPKSLLVVTQTLSWTAQQDLPITYWKVIESKETLLGAVLVSEHHVHVPREAKEERLDQERKKRNLAPKKRKKKPSGPPERRLQVGQEFRMGGALAFGERRMGQIPLLLHPSPERALFLGVGTGATLGAVDHHASLQHVDAVELVPAVLDMLPQFSAINGEVTDDDRVHLHAADARRFVAASDDHYDVIVADLFHPGRDGAGNLYAKEHFENIAERLADDGLFAQWLPLHQLDPQSLRVVIRTFSEVFGEVHAILGNYNVRSAALVLIGRDPSRCSGPLSLDVASLSERMSAPIYRELLMDPRDLLGAYLLDSDGLDALAGDGPQTSDLFPWITMQAPRSAYEESETRARDNVMDLLDVQIAVPESMLVANDPQALGAFQTEVTEFSTALGHYLRGESARLDADDPLQGISDAVDHYLAAYDVAPQFRPARGMLLQSARAAPHIAERVFPAMVERTPQERLVWQEYAGYLHRTRDPRLPEVIEQGKQALGLPDAAQP